MRQIDFSNREWHLGLPNTCGWYYLKTNTPFTTLAALPAPPSEYTNGDGEQKKCRNYNISSRASSLINFNKVSNIVISHAESQVVYSGMAKNLLSRAREHTFGHFGTAGLALSNYPSVTEYDWMFFYLENSIEQISNAHRNTVLKLGEQIWRANNGWPILCAG